jgi:hypothetical protein
MTTTTAAPGLDVPLFSVAGAFLEGLASQDIARILGTLEADAHMRALVPVGLKEWHGTEEIGATFRRWFVDVEEFELVEAVVGEIGPRLHLRWRARVQAQWRGDGWFVVEQQVYADTGPDGRIARLSLLCSGFCPEAPTSAGAPS